MATITVRKGDKAFLDGQHKVLVKYIGPVWSVSNPYSAAHTVAGGGNAFASSEHRKSDVWVGIAFDQPIGKHGGKVNGIRYFTCKPKHGVFVRPHRLTLSEDEEPAPAPPRTKKKAHGPPRVARMLGRPQQAPVSTQGRLPPTSTRKARGPPRVAMLAQQSREQRALDTDSGQTLPRHNVRLKKSKGPAALFRENVVGASHKGPKKPTTAWGSPESKGTSSEVREALEAAAQALELNEDNLEDKPDFMEASEDDFADERQIMMEKTHERSSAEKIMDALQSDFMAGRKEGTASEGGRVVAGAPNVVADADSNNANVGGDDADENLLVPHDEAKMAYERVLVVKRGPAGKLGMHLADWEQGGTGVIVDSVAQSGPADRCGVKANDVLISIDDKPVLDKNKGEVAEIIHSCGERFAVVVSQEVKLLAMRIAEEAKAAKDNVAAEVAREMSLLQAKLDAEQEERERKQALRDAEQERQRAELEAALEEERQRLQEEKQRLQEEHIARVAAENAVLEAESRRNSLFEQKKAAEAELARAKKEHELATASNESHWEAVKAKKAAERTVAELEAKVEHEGLAASPTGDATEQMRQSEEDQPQTKPQLTWAEIKAARAAARKSADDQEGSQSDDSADVAGEVGATGASSDLEEAESMKAETNEAAITNTEEPARRRDEESTDVDGEAEGCVAVPPDLQLEVRTRDELDENVTQEAKTEAGPDVHANVADPDTTSALDSPRIEVDESAEPVTTAESQPEHDESPTRDLATSPTTTRSVDSDHSTTNVRSNTKGGQAVLHETQPESEKVVDADVDVDAFLQDNSSRLSSSSDVGGDSHEQDTVDDDVDAFLQQNASRLGSSTEIEREADKSTEPSSAPNAERSDDDTAVDQNDPVDTGTDVDVDAFLQENPSRVGSSSEVASSAQEEGLADDDVDAFLQKNASRLDSSTEVEEKVDTVAESASVANNAPSEVSGDDMTASQTVVEPQGTEPAVDKDASTNVEEETSGAVVDSVLSTIVEAAITEVSEEQLAPTDHVGEKKNEQVYRATADFAAQEDDDLELRRGDVISDVVVIDDSWMSGRVGGRVGIFPSGFAEPYDGSGSKKDEQDAKSLRTSAERLNAMAIAQSQREADLKAKGLAEEQALADEVARAKAQSAARDKAKAKSDELARKAAEEDAASKQRIQLNHVPRDDLPEDRVATQSLFLKFETDEARQQNEGSERTRKDTTVADSTQMTGPSEEESDSQTEAAPATSQNKEESQAESDTPAVVASQSEEVSGSQTKTKLPVVETSSQDSVSPTEEVRTEEGVDVVSVETNELSEEAAVVDNMVVADATAQVGDTQGGPEGDSPDTRSASGNAHDDELVEPETTSAKTTARADDNDSKVFAPDNRQGKSAEIRGFDLAMTTSEVSEWLVHCGYPDAAAIVEVNNLDGQDLGSMETIDLMNDLEINEQNALILKQQIDASKPPAFDTNFTAAEAAAWLELNGMSKTVIDELERHNFHGQDLVDLIGEPVYFAECVPASADREKLTLLIPHTTPLEPNLVPISFHADWNTEELAVWANRLSYPTLAQNILSNELTAEDLQELTQDELADLLNGEQSLTAFDEIWGIIHEDRVEHLLRHERIPGPRGSVEGRPIPEPEELLVTTFKIGYDTVQLCEWLEAVGHTEATNVILENDLTGTDLYYCDVNDLMDVFGGLIPPEEVEAMMRQVKAFTPIPFHSGFSANDVAEWLYDQGFTHCAEPIIEHGLDGADLLTMKDEDWDDLGITSEALFEALRSGPSTVAL
eukprot:m.67793 g.67793  ORF g.67793 m.67793 type:complete len:1775 (-) comp9882_c0_seq1:87-5411(-)